MDWYLVGNENGTLTLWITSEEDHYTLGYSVDQLETYATREEALKAYREQTDDCQE